MKNVVGKLAAFSLLLPPFSYANAQAEQTPKNAQKFLQLTLPMNLRVSSTEGSSDAVRGAIVPSDDVCDTRFPVTFNSQSHDLGFHWQYVVRTTQRDSFVEVTSKWGVTMTFNFGAKELATRAAYAMEFLRQHCDPAKNTGF